MTARTKKAILTTGAIAGALVAVAGLVVPPARYVDARYVHTDSFAIHQAGEATKAAIDSLNYSRDMKEVRQTLTDIRADVSCLRHPKREVCK